MRFLLVFGLLCSVLMAGGDASGIWVGQIPGRFGDVQDLAFRFSHNGSQLTGKIYGESESLPITDGTINGDQLTFRVTTEMNGGLSHFLFRGTIRGDQIELTRYRELPPDAEEEQKKRNKPQQVTLKRLI